MKRFLACFFFLLHFSLYLACLSQLLCPVLLVVSFSSPLSTRQPAFLPLYNSCSPLQKKMGKDGKGLIKSTDSGSDVSTHLRKKKVQIFNKKKKLKKNIYLLAFLSLVITWLILYHETPLNLIFYYLNSQNIGKGPLHVQKRHESLKLMPRWKTRNLILSP